MESARCLGDVFELLKYTYEDIRKANPTLMRYFTDNNFIFIKGNHDIVNDFGLDHYFPVLNAI